MDRSRTSDSGVGSQTDLSGVGTVLRPVAHVAFQATARTDMKICSSCGLHCATRMACRRIQIYRSLVGAAWNADCLAAESPEARTHSIEMALLNSVVRSRPIKDMVRDAWPD
jgi:hypothetical protein